jgi:hypothetical protein
VTFTGGHTGTDLQHWLFVGTTPRAYDLVNRDLGTGHATTVSGLPASGTIHVTFWTLFSGRGWLAASQQYTMSVLPPQPSPITSPAPGSTITSSTVTFTGGHTTADLQHWLFVGTTPGAYDLVNRDLGTGHATTVSGLPASGTIHVTFWTLFSGRGWLATSQQYTMSR